MPRKGERHTPSRQGERSNFVKLTEEAIRHIRTRHNEGVSIKDLAIEHSVTYGAIYAIVRRRNWRHVA